MEDILNILRSLRPQAPDFPENFGIIVISLGLLLLVYFIRRLYERQGQKSANSIGIFLAFLMIASGRLLPDVYSVSPWVDYCATQKELNGSLYELPGHPGILNVILGERDREPKFEACKYLDNNTPVTAYTWLEADSLPSKEIQEGIKATIHRKAAWLTHDDIELRPFIRNVADAAEHAGFGSGKITIKDLPPNRSSSGPNIVFQPNTPISKSDEKRVQNVIRNAFPSLPLTTVTVVHNPDIWLLLGEFSGQDGYLELRPAATTFWPEGARSSKNSLTLRRYFIRRELALHDTNVCVTRDIPKLNGDNCIPTKATGAYVIAKIQPVGSREGKIWAKLAAN